MNARSRVGRGVAAATAVLLLGSCSATGQRTDPSASRSTSTTGSSRSTTTEAPATTSPPTPAPALRWTRCDGDFECARVTVPVDYDHPRGPTLSLALVRRPAADRVGRIGSLLVNPGGPGGSAIETVEATPFPGELVSRFDIVGFDPRGVGRSSPLRCHRHLQDIYDVDPTMEDAADRSAFLRASEKFVDECQAKYATLLPHLGTENVARDMDRVRAALGDEKLTYLGYSYGTSIGEQYARLFPTKVRAMVLDGVVDPGLTGLEAAAEQARGFTKGLDAFIAECDRAGCGLDSPAGRVIDQVIAASERAPIPAPGADRPATPGIVALALSQALYSELLWPALAGALGGAQRGDATELVALADQYLQRNPDGSYPNGFEIYFAVSCLDSAWPDDPAKIFAAAERVGSRYPRIGEALVNDYVRCALWPTEPQPLQPVPPTVKGLPPIVVISTTGDPATPYESGVRVAAQIPGAVLVTNEGEGHTVFAQGKSCIDRPVTRYLVTLVPPGPDLTCPAR